MFIIQPYEDILDEAMSSLNTLKSKHSIPESDYTDLLKSYRKLLAKIEIKRENNKNTMFDLMEAQDLYEAALNTLYDEAEKLRNKN